MKSECIELDTDSRNWIPDNLSDQWFADNLSDQWFAMMDEFKAPWRMRRGAARSNFPAASRKKIFSLGKQEGRNREKRGERAARPLAKKNHGRAARAPLVFRRMDRA
jgi:hypothetical protein